MGHYENGTYIPDTLEQRDLHEAGRVPARPTYTSEMYERDKKARAKGRGLPPPEEMHDDVPTTAERFHDEFDPNGEEL